MVGGSQASACRLALMTLLTAVISLDAHAGCPLPNGQCVAFGLCGTGCCPKSMAETAVDLSRRFPSDGKVIGWCVDLGGTASTATISFEVFRPVLDAGAIDCVASGPAETITGGTSQCFSLSTPIDVATNDVIGAEVGAGAAVFANVGTLVENSAVGCVPNVTGLRQQNSGLSIWAQFCAADAGVDGGGADAGRPDAQAFDAGKSDGGARDSGQVFLDAGGCLTCLDAALLPPDATGGLDAAATVADASGPNDAGNTDANAPSDSGTRGAGADVGCGCGSDNAGWAWICPLVAFLETRKRRRAQAT